MSLDNNDDRLNTILQKVKNAICEIRLNNNLQGLGFLVSLPVNIGNRYLYGLLTANHIISRNELKDGNILNLSFKETKKVFDFTISQNNYAFTCDFIDVTFVEIPGEFNKDVEYLQIVEEPIEKQKLLVCQLDENGEIIFVEGDSLGFYGTKILFNIKGSYKNNAICTPIISLSEESLGNVIAIRENNSLNGKESNFYSGINFNIIFLSIKNLIHQNKIKHNESLSSAKKLSLTEIHVLRKEGLKETENSNVFISPGSQGITPLWFYRTHYAWYWTPTEPKTFEKDDLEKCNWSLIQGNSSIKAIGGFWNGLAPAERNVILIKYLINSGLRFLLE